MLNLTALNWVLTAIGAILVAQSAFLLIETLAAWYSTIRTRSNADQEHNGTSFAVLIPAHDEAGGIESTLAELIPQVGDEGRILIVADNCTDDTATQALRLGVNVLVRHDPERRGKGFAIQAGIDELAKMPPDVVVIFDADCRVTRGALSDLAGSTSEANRPVQAAYVMPAGSGNRISDRISAFAVAFKNVVRPMGLRCLGAPCLLTGSGMGIPWKLAAETCWASGDIVEDMTIGVQMAISGHFPMYLNQVELSAELPASASAARQQRTRWEHGHLKNIQGIGLQLLMAAVRRPSWRLLVVFMELSVPPLSLFAMSIAVLVVAACGLSLHSSSLMPALASLAAAVLFGLSIINAWCLVGGNLLKPTELAWAPMYAIRKAPIYAASVFKRETQWRRTDRGTPASEAVGSNHHTSVVNDL